MTEATTSGWPKISIVIGGAQDSPATGDTARSVAAGDYPGEVQVLTGSVGEHGSPAAIANSHAAEASGSFLMMLPPGAKLDAACLRRLVERLGADDQLPAVTPEWHGADGSLLEPARYSMASIEIHALPRALLGAPATARLPADPIPGGSMLTPTRRFFAIGGFDLSLDGTPYLGPDFGYRLADSDVGVDIERGAVAIAPERPADDAPTGASTAGLPPPRAYRPRPHRVLWAAAHLPDRDRSGIDERQFEMIESLARSGADVLVWADHDSGSHQLGNELTAAGIQWITPPPDLRWGLGNPPAASRWLDELLGGVDWDTVVVGDPRLFDRIADQLRALAPGAQRIVDLGTAGWAVARTADSDPVLLGDIVPGLREVDGVSVPSAVAAASLEETVPGLPAFVFGALGRGPGGGGSSDGGLLFIGDLFDRPNLLAIEWWIDEIAALVEARLGRPAPLRIVGHGSEVYRAVWDHPSKIDMAGRQPDLTAELDRARLLVVPTTTVTGNSGRIATALAHGLPVVASSAAAAVIAPDLADLVHQAEDAAGMASLIADLASDDAAWEDARDRIAAADIGALREAQTSSLIHWMDRITPENFDPAGGRTRRTRRSRPAPRRPRRAS